MTRQCIGCGTLLPEEGRSLRCPRCWKERQMERNRKNVRAHRGRAARVNFPTIEEIEWLDGLNLDLADPVADLLNLIEAGKPGNDPEVLATARGALDRYDGIRGGFDARVATLPDAAGLARGWRDFYEYLRGVLK
jgi:hypothetical protein